MRIEIKKNATANEAAKVIAEALKRSGYAHPVDIAERAVEWLKAMNR
jgi:hypothetical protein